MQTIDGQPFFARPPHPSRHGGYHGRLIIGGQLDGCVTNCAEREFVHRVRGPGINTEREAGAYEVPPYEEERYVVKRLGPYKEAINLGPFTVYVLHEFDWLRWLLQCHPVALEFTGGWLPQPE